jgi:cytochrome c-type biogenesis protein CcmH
VKRGPLRPSGTSPSKLVEGSSTTVNRAPPTCWGSCRVATEGALLAIFLLTIPAHAVQPGEILKDPALESRARDISSGLRCLVCQNQSIDDSDAPVAKDLRMLIREQLTDGKSDAEVVDFVVARYGEYVLLQPRLRAGTLLLWLTPFAILLASLLFVFRRRPSQKLEALSAAEKAELQRLVGKQP